MAMNIKPFDRCLVIGFLILVQACASNPLGRFFEKPYFTAPQTQMTREDREIFDRALFRQENNRVQAAIKVWKQFLQKHPRSFEAHNNLGLMYFADDQVDPSILEFETALSLEPNDSKIKKNLVRVLKFKATLLNEAKGYNGAVDTLKRAQEISPPEQKEKIGFIIEKFEDKVFEQAKATNTVEAYEGFLKRFPNSGKKADEARMKIAGLIPVDPKVSATALDGMQMEAPSPAPDEKETPKSDSAPDSSIVTKDNGDMRQATSRVEDSIQKSMDKDRTVADGSTLKDEAGQMLETAGKANVKDEAGQILGAAEEVEVKDGAGQVLNTAKKAVERPLIESLDKEIIPEQPKEAVRSVERPIAIAT